jgi:hypothetical protein
MEAETKKTLYLLHLRGKEGRRKAKYTPDEKQKDFV